MFGPFLRRRNEAKAREYLERCGAMELLRTGEGSEIPPVLHDLHNLHAIVRRRRPTTILEFGTGFSTLVLAHALSLNAREAPPAGPAKAKATLQPPPKLWSVDANERWIRNAAGKVPDSLRGFVEFHHSEVRACEVNGQLCHRYVDLPSVVPDFVYLDAPNPLDVVGEVGGLSFTLESGGPRQAAAADLILLEPSLKGGFFMVVDGRFNNVHFLRHNLRRRYRVRVDNVNKLSTFELLEATGRH
ncbi:MAG: hypothetical protein IPK81_07430 [Rhodospirillales bacterium]|nr:hypothetical protein [Rhodospirillales bacterium]QQS14009.1 MAG: hypothetical protein IPK81_07430 [Rhodospirillales bacterium]